MKRLLAILVLLSLSFLAASVDVEAGGGCCSGATCGCDVIQNECLAGCQNNFSCIGGCKRDYIDCGIACCGS